MELTYEERNILCSFVMEKANKFFAQADQMYSMDLRMIKI